MLSRPREGGEGGLSGFLRLMMLPATRNSQVLVRAWQLMTLRQEGAGSDSRGRGMCGS